MGSVRNSWIVLVSMAVVLAFAPDVGSASSDPAAQIHRVCASHSPRDPKAQRNCRKRQAAAATRLLSQTEAAAETSLKFAVAKSCIELARSKRPAMIDWIQALACFESQRVRPKLSKPSKPGVAH